MSEESKPLSLLSLSEFKLERAIAEIRYEDAYLFWDRVGSIWNSVRLEWPGLKALHAEPGKTTFEDSGYSVAIEIGAARVVASNPGPSLDEFAKKCNLVFSTVVRKIELNAYARVALRVIYRKHYATTEEASAALIKTTLLRIPPGKVFGINTGPSNLEYAARWESPTMGVAIRLRSELRKIEFNVPAELAGYLEPVKKEYPELVFDVDRFSAQPVEVGQMEFTEWIRQAHHYIRKESSEFLGY